MYLFTRSTRLVSGGQRKSMEWAIGVTEKVNQITSLNIGLWTTMMSPGVGTISWSTFVEHLSDLEDANAKLMADDMFVELVDTGAAFTNHIVDDETAQLLTAIDPSRNPTHVAVVRSQLANGSFQRGVEVGIEIAERATRLGGNPTAFVLSSTGTYAGCAWLTGAMSLQELEKAEQAVNMDPDFIAFLDANAAECYLPGVTTQAIWQRLV